MNERELRLYTYNTGKYLAPQPPKINTENLLRLMDFQDKLLNKTNKRAAAV